MLCSLNRRVLLATTVCAAALSPLAAAANSTGAKNVMFFIADGTSWGTWDMASYYQYGEKGRQAYDQFDVKLGATTLPASTPQAVYNANAAWNATPSGDADHFAGYTTLKNGYTDSAAAGTALASGTKTTNGRINIDPNDMTLGFVSQAMKESGRSVGVLSSVPFSHATPGAFGAQNISRNNYGEIAAQMINDGTVDVIMGGGNPLYDQNGDLRADPLYNRINEAEWNALNGAGAPMTLLQDKADFEAIANGSMTIDGRVIGLPKVGDTLQQGRDAALAGADAANPTGLAYNDDVPTLTTMTRAALNLLAQDPDGMFMMVEGGAVDWAAHANQTDRIIEEMIDFNHAVESAVEWVNANSSWEETLIIVATDHGNGMPMGPDSDTVAFQPIQNNGAGNLPGVQWHYGTHTTENTLMWAHGAGSELFANYLEGNDPFLASLLGFNNGDYITNTTIPKVMAEAAGISAVPLPASIWLFGSAFGAMGVLRRRKRKAA